MTLLESLRAEGILFENPLKSSSLKGFNLAPKLLKLAEG